MKDMERRTVPVQLKIERREGQSPKIRGHAAVFNVLSEDLGGFRERIAPGAFTEAIEKDDVRALWNHNSDFPLGRNKAGTLTLREDEKGLAIEIDPPDTQVARDLAVSIERGDVSQMSFAFSVRLDGQEWDRDEDGFNVRTLKAVRLFDVSPVTYPAYTATDVAVRSMKEWLKRDEDPKEHPGYALRHKQLDLMEVE